MLPVWHYLSVPLKLQYPFKIEVTGKIAKDPGEALRSMGPFDYPLPKNFSQANGFYCPNGREVGKGWFLLTKRDVDLLDLNGLQDVFLSDGYVNILLDKLVISAQPLRVIGGSDDDPAGLYLVELADRRHLCKNEHFSITINEHYNVRAPGWPDGEFYRDSLNDNLSTDGEPWTWDQMIGDVWELMAPQLGDYPGLPVDPNGKPEGFRFVGTSAWDALNDLLYRVGCQIAVDLNYGVAQQFTIVQIGAEDTAVDDLIAEYQREGRKVQDRQMLDIYRGRTPFGVRVHFPRIDPFGTEHALSKGAKQWSTTPVYSISIDGPTLVTSNSESDVYHPLYDDLTALYDADGTLTNADDLKDRAQERADDFYRMLRVGGGLRALTFSGVVRAKIKGTFKAVAWHQARDGGLCTDLLNHPWRDLKFSDGQWVPTHMRPPDFGPTWPIWPHVEHLVKIRGTYGADPSGSVVYTATVEHKNPDTGEWITECECHVTDANDATLVSGRRYKARMNGSIGGHPWLLTDRDPVPQADYYGRKGLFCIDIEKQKCVNGVLIDDSISIHTDVPIWMSHTKCASPTSGGDPHDPNNDGCAPGQVDTAAFTPNDCDAATYSFSLAGLANGTCSDCANLIQSYTLNWNSLVGKWLWNSSGEACGGVITTILQYSNGYYELLIYANGNGAVYRLDGMSWNTSSPNTLVRLTAEDPGWCNDWPATITVS